MVLRVCRHIIGGPNDVDDAFQATFLVLARKARSVRVGDSLGPWLYGVACRVATRARAVSRRRNRRETTGVGEITAAASDADALADIRPVLHEEIGRLPAKYRTPVVLCHLDGLTHEEAARQLRCPVGTVSGRLSRARRLLRARLTRRGLSPTAPAVVAALAPQSAKAMPPSLLASTVEAATAKVVSPAVVSLTRGVLKVMLLHKLKLGTIVAAAICVLAVGAGYVAGHASDAAFLPAQSEPGQAPKAQTPAATPGSPPPAPPPQHPGTLPAGPRACPSRARLGDSTPRSA